MCLVTFDTASMTGEKAKVEVQKKNSEEIVGKSFVTQRIINVCNGPLGRAAELRPMGSFL